MPELNRITVDPEVMGGKPCIRGLRVTVGTVVGLVAAGHSREEILRLHGLHERPRLRCDSRGQRRLGSERDSGATDLTPARLGSLVQRALVHYRELFEAGALITIEEARLRVRILPLKKRI